MIRTTSSVSLPPRTQVVPMTAPSESCVAAIRRATGCGSCFRRSLASDKARKFAIASLEEAKAYLRHAVLSPRLIECARIVAEAQARTAEQIFGGVDAQELHSSMTLFLRAAPGEPLFGQVLDRYFDGRPDSATDERV